MSGTNALLSFPVCGAGIHRRFGSARINGVPSIVGPCPNESLGIIDVMVFGTEEGDDPRHGGSSLFRDLAAGEEVTAEAVSHDGRTAERALTAEDMPTSKPLSSRNCFRNYRAFVNPGDSEFSSIFSCLPSRRTAAAWRYRAAAI